MDVKILAVDIDGTVLRSDGTISAVTVEALRAVRDKGIEVILCTGRRLRSTLPIARKIGVMLPLVLQNGSIVKSPVTTETVFARYLDRSLCLRVADLMLSRDYVPLIYTDTYEAGVDFYTLRRRSRSPRHTAYLQRNRATGRVLDRLEELPTDRIAKVLCFGEVEECRRLSAEVQAAFDVNACVLSNVEYVGILFEVFAKGISKFTGFLECLKLSGYSLDSVAAIGDDMNDLELLRSVPLSIAMGNAVPEVKAAARFVTATNDEDGLALAIREHLL